MDGLEADTKLLHDLADYAQLKPSALAREIGAAVTTITRPFNGKAATRLSQPTLEKLRERWPEFPGWLQPVEVVPPSNGIVKALEGAPDIQLPRDLPVFGTSLGAPRDFDGHAIEQIMLNTGNVIDHIQRPAILHGKDYAYALYVQGSSMDPRFEDGDTIYVTDSRRAKPPRIGDDVVVYIRDMNEDDGHSATGVLVKRLVRRTAQYIELQQFNPAEIFRIPADIVLRTDRVIPWREIVA
ncbi:S24 family peptidase [Novosphingobium sp. HII-3]|uniref:S24 family peptidase n=1 Tax=Novosphingobium sp. HII-3 TaxID=2075565 RepID=UPI001304A5A7|nr:LexA family transcriptional regulator [Novosphingobium sp. HII-3]